MATTTNYGWTTPDDTALVSQGAAAIRTLGSSIDSTLKTQIDAQIPDSLLTTKGDLIAATGAATPARLGVGANDQVLIADSTTATGLKWGTAAAGGMTLLASGNLSSTEVSITGISSSYINLLLFVSNPFVNTGSPLVFRVNNNSTADYNGVTTRTDTSTNVLITSTAYFQPSDGSNLPTSSSNVSYWFNILNYTTSIHKNYQFGGTSTSAAYSCTGWKNVTAAISSIQIRMANGTSTFSGGTYSLYGVK